MPKKEPKKASAKRGYTEEEVNYRLDSLKKEEDKAFFLDKILSEKGLLTSKTYKAIKKSADEVYMKAAVRAAWEGSLDAADELSKKVRNKRVMDEGYGKEAMKAVKKGEFNYAIKLTERIKNKKLANKMYEKMAVFAAEVKRFEEAGEFAEKARNKKLVSEMYGKAAMKEAEEGRFGDAGEFAKKSEKYLKQNHPDVLANIYEKTGDAKKAEDIRKRLEAKGKKK